jgi:branched-chain amino acid transport system substrate-binding protein
VAIGIALTQSNHSAIELAAREINEGGGVRGVRLEVMGLDWIVRDHFEPIEILKWSNRFAQTKDLVAVIGHSDSASTLSAAAVYNQEKIPQIVTIATNPAITNIGSWTYRMCISDEIQGNVLAEYAVREWGKKRLVIFYVNDAYGIGLSEIFERRARNLGAQILSNTMLRNVLRADDEELIRLTIERVKQSNPDLFVLFQRMEPARWIVRATRAAGLKTDMLGGDSLGSIGFVKDDPKLVEGMRISQFYFPAENDERCQSFAQGMREYGVEPDYARALSYDAVYLLRDAIHYGGFSREGVKSYLDNLIKQRTVINGAGGSYSIGADHDARRPLYVVEVKAGEHRLVKAYPAS